MFSTLLGKAVDALLVVRIELCQRCVSAAQSTLRVWAYPARHKRVRWKGRWHASERKISPGTRIQTKQIPAYRRIQTRTVSTHNTRQESRAPYRTILISQHPWGVARGNYPQVSVHPSGEDGSSTYAVVCFISRRDLSWPNESHLRRQMRRSVDTVVGHSHPGNQKSFFKAPQRFSRFCHFTFPTTLSGGAARGSRPATIP